jgi:hypothetical protein
MLVAGQYGHAMTEQLNAIIIKEGIKTANKFKLPI